MLSAQHVSRHAIYNDYVRLLREHAVQRRHIASRTFMCFVSGRCKVQTAGLLASLPAGIPLAAVVADLRKPEGRAGAGQVAEQLLKTDQAAAVQRQASADTPDAVPCFLRCPSGAEGIRPNNQHDVKSFELLHTSYKLHWVMHAWCFFP